VLHILQLMSTDMTQLKNGVKEIAAQIPPTDVHNEGLGSEVLMIMQETLHTLRELMREPTATTSYKVCASVSKPAAMRWCLQRSRDCIRNADHERRQRFNTIRELPEVTTRRCATYIIIIITTKLQRS
jgi:hypothetical protein